MCSGNSPPVKGADAGPWAAVAGTHSDVKKSFKSACEVAGIKHSGVDGATLHSLRHTAAARLVIGRMPLQMVGRVLGHSQPQTTYRYLAADAETAAQAAAILDSFQARTDEAREAGGVVN